MKRLCTGSLFSLGLGVGLVGLAGCQKSGDATAAQAFDVGPPPIAAMTDTSVPMAMGDEVDSPWEYLKRKYDADEDGRVTQDEYDRERTQFDRLDRSGDGVITAEDFARTGRGNRMQAYRAQRTVSSYFQLDEENDHLPLAELEEAFGRYDADGDAVIDRVEFELAAEERRVALPGAERMRRMMGDADPWDLLLAGTDEDGDGRLAAAELVSFFKAQDEDGDGVWAIRDPTAGRRGGRRPGAGAARPSEPGTGPVTGSMAPDFTLMAPNGGMPVTLSSFRKNKPVALIFGSYT